MTNKKYITIDELETIHCERECQETAINFCRDDDRMIISVSDNTMMTKLIRVMRKNPEAFTIWEAGRDHNGYVGGYNIECSKNLLSLKSGKKKKREMTEEQRKAVRERFVKGKAKKEN